MTLEITNKNKANGNGNGKKDDVLYYHTTKLTTILPKYKKIGITIGKEDKGIWDDFREIVVRKTGKLHGSFSEALTELVRNHVLQYKQHHATTSLQGSDYRADVQAKIETVRKAWIDQSRLVFKEKEFQESIGQILNLRDLRTIRKYSRLIFAMGCIREKAGVHYFIKVSGFTGFDCLDGKYERDDSQT